MRMPNLRMTPIDAWLSYVVVARIRRRWRWVKA